MAISFEGNLTEAEALVLAMIREMAFGSITVRIADKTIVSVSQEVCIQVKKISGKGLDKAANP